jgi:NAD(P)-dependent dehydrogenase (short-subunit alcohol dehydrogenase family)
VVVGGSRGLGRHLALRALGRGDRVLATGRSGDDLARLAAAPGEGLRERLEVLAGDFLTATAPLGAVRAWLEAGTGPVTVVVSAANLGPVGPLSAVDLEAWATSLEANVVGTARILAALLPVLTRDDLVLTFAGGGVGGPRPQPHVSSYTVSKTALSHLVEVFARENPDGPVVVAVAPGAYPTGFTAPVRDADPALAGEALLADVAKTASLPFDTDDLDAMVDYLESGARWLSGRTVSARRDTPDRLREVGDGAGDDLFRLRRVDGVGVVAQAW